MQRDRKVLLGLHTLPRKMVNSQGVSTDFQHAIENFQNKIARLQQKYFRTPCCLIASSHKAKKDVRLLVILNSVLNSSKLSPSRKFTLIIARSIDRVGS